MDDSTTQSPLLDPECRVPIVPFASELRLHRIPRAWEGYSVGFFAPMLPIWTATGIG